MQAVKKFSFLGHEASALVEYVIGETFVTNITSKTCTVPGAIKEMIEFMIKHQINTITLNEVTIDAL